MLEKIRQAFRNFMQGRHGPDQLTAALCFGSIFLYVVDLFAQTGILLLASAAMAIYALFRALSRNDALRSEENRKFVARTSQASQRARQAKARFDNRKQYKYVKCPSCRQWIRLPRGAGSVSVTCKHCRNSFDQRA